MGVILGVISGILVTKGRLQPFIATLITMTAYRGLAKILTDGKPISQLAATIESESGAFFFKTLGKGNLAATWNPSIRLPIPAIILVLTFVIFYFILNHTTFGRRVYATGSNEKCAKLVGVNTARVKVWVYGISGFLAALAGLIMISRVDSAQPTLAEGYELDAIAAVALGGTGCMITIDGEGTAAASGTVSNSIGLSVSTQNNPFFVTLVEGAEAAAQELGVKLTVVDAGDDVTKQASDIEDLVSKQVGVLIVNPVDSDAVSSAVSSTVSRGVKVISVDRAVNGVEIDCQIASDNVAGAEMATQYIVDTLGEGIKVAELQGTVGASAAIDRGQGFHNVADEKLDVVSSQPANFDRTEGMSVMENMLQSNGDIQAVFAANDEMALGAVEAISGAGKDIMVVGFDATDDAIEAIKAGRMDATIAQQPDLIGKTAVEQAVKLINGETIDKAIPVEVTLITKDNA